MLGSRTPSRFYFTLTPPDGTTVTGATYRGKWLIAGALAQIGRDATRLQPIFIVVDPSTDLYIRTPQGKFVRGLDFDTPGGRIADTLRARMAPSGRMKEIMAGVAERANFEGQ